MMSSPAHTSEKQLIQKYNQLKQTLIEQSALQRNSALKSNTHMTMLFQNVSDLLNIFTDKIRILKQQNASLKKSLGKYQKSQYQDNLSSNQIQDDFPNFKFDEQINDLNFPDISEIKKEENSRDDIIDFKKDTTLSGNYFKNALKKMSQNISKQFRPYEAINPTAVKGGKQRRSSLSQKSYRLKHRSIIKEQMSFVSRYVKECLSSSLVYSSDHSRNYIPKKYILSQYVRWCKHNKRKILYEKLSVVQMLLTNQLKILFPKMDSYTKSYRGLLMTQQGKKPEQKKYQNALQVQMEYSPEQ